MTKDLRLITVPHIEYYTRIDTQEPTKSFGKRERTDGLSSAMGGDV